MNTLQKRINQRGQGGFTLIELLVVIAILAILAGVVVFAVGNSTDNAKLTACKAEAKTLSVAANAAKAANLTNATKQNWTAFTDSNTSEYFNITGDLSASTPTAIAFTAKTGIPSGCNPPATVNP